MENMDFKKADKNGVKITYVNKERMQKRNSFSLKKIAVNLLVTGLIIVVATKVVPAIYNEIKTHQTRDEKNKEALANLDSDEMFIEDVLATYSIALDDYKNIIKEDNHSKQDEIDKRVAVVSAGNQLIEIAKKLVENKVLEAFDLSNSNGYVRSSVITYGSSGDPPERVLSVYEDNEDIYTTKNLPNDVSAVLSCADEVSLFRGTGESERWDKGINKYIRQANDLYNTILDLTTKELNYEDGKITSNDEVKNY